MKEKNATTFPFGDDGGTSQTTRDDTQCDDDEASHDDARHHRHTIHPHGTENGTRMGRESAASV